MEDKKETNNEEEEKVEEGCLIINRGNKTFLNLIWCELNIGLAFTYLYIFSAAMLYVVNRIINFYLISLLFFFSN